MRPGGTLSFRGQAEVQEQADDLTKTLWEKHCISILRHKTHSLWRWSELLEVTDCAVGYSTQEECLKPNLFSLIHSVLNSSSQVKTENSTTLQNIHKLEYKRDVLRTL